ncbi:hypothetical protein ABZ801_34910 [Actinomadura sp. NPDC047616]|uniref:hypothetical protein n=1 Tax=Actinomadura sp. NPDC047616 TaxID=3155914 RepID=UPI0033FC4D69
MTRIAAWVALALAVTFLSWSGRALWQTWHDSDATAFARERDLVLRTGTREVAMLNSIDWTRPDEGLRRWRDASTGPLRDRLQRESATSRQKILRARTSAVANVDDAAVTSLDVRTGTAQLIAAVRIRLTPQGGQTTVQRKRYEAGLTRTSSGWRLKSLTVLPVSAR